MTVRYILSLSVFFGILSAARFAPAAVTASLTIPIDSTWRAIGPVGDLTGQGINNVGFSMGIFPCGLELSFRFR